MAKAIIKEDYNIQVDKMANTVVKTASIVVYDTSYSTGANGAAKAIEDGIKTYLKALNEDSFASNSIDLALMSFNHEYEKTLDFTPVKELSPKDVPTITPSGGTDMNLAVLEGLKELKNREAYYKSNKIKFKSSWLFLITDGYSQEDITPAATKTTKLINQKNLTMIVVGAGTDVDTTELNKFDPVRPVIFSPSTSSIKEVFVWLSHVSIAVSKSNDGEKVTVKPLEAGCEFIG